MIIGTAQSITKASKRVLIVLEALEEIEVAAKYEPFMVRAGDIFLKMYYQVCLRKEKRILLQAVTSSFKCNEPDVFLAAGNVLQKVEAFQEAKYCYGRVIELLDDCNEQDMRLLALMGKLECIVSISKDELHSEKIDTQGGYREAKTWYGIIDQDLDATSPSVRDEIKKRLSAVYAIMFSNAIRSKVNEASWMFNNPHF